jgi:hypothetical protein
VTGLLQYFDQRGLWTQWYWRPEGVHGKVWNLAHGYGWQVV